MTGPGINRWWVASRIYFCSGVNCPGSSAQSAGARADRGRSLIGNRCGRANWQQLVKINGHRHAPKVYSIGGLYGQQTTAQTQPTDGKPE